MLSRPFLNRIVRDESLVRGLGDPEARVLIEWVVERAEQVSSLTEGGQLSDAIRQLCLRARSIARFVHLWCHQRALGPATQLAAVERFCWPLPVLGVDPCLLMQEIVSWEDEQDAGH